MSKQLEAPRAVSTGVRWWVVVCVLGVFGPYVASGARTEQLLMYGSAVVVVVTQFPRLLVLLRPAALVLGLWAAYAAVAVLGGFLLDNRTPWPSGSLVAGVDNALLATVTAYLGLSAVPGLGRFWAAGGYDASVAVLAEQMGRFSGIFNQPAEAGVAYSLAVLAILYLARSEGRDRPWLLWTLLVLAVVGGLLTLSKVFVVGGMFLAFLLALSARRHRTQAVGVGAGTIAGVAALGFSGLAGSWGASTMFAWYKSSHNAGDSWLYTASAGRFGAASTTGPPSITPAMVPAEPSVPAAGDAAAQASAGAGAGASADPGSSAGADPVPLPRGLGDLARQVFDEHPLWGVGARGLQVAYDSTWAEALVVGGAVGLTLVVAVHLVLVWRWVSARQSMPPVTWWFAGAVVVLTVGASFGMPALTGNRESTLLWMFLVPLLVAPRVLGVPSPHHSAQGRSRSADPISA